MPRIPSDLSDEASHEYANGSDDDRVQTKTKLEMGGRNPRFSQSVAALPVDKFTFSREPPLPAEMTMIQSSPSSSVYRAMPSGWTYPVEITSGDDLADSSTHEVASVHLTLVSS